MSRQPTFGLFGATGFIGSYILSELINANYSVKALVRNKASISVNQLPHLDIIEGDLQNSSAIKQIVKNSDMLIYAVGIIRENSKKGIMFKKLHYKYFKNIVDIAQAEHIEKIIYISANGVENQSTQYQLSKLKAEEYLINNFNNWTIFRPSVVFGDPGRKVEFISQLKTDIIDKPIPVPLFFHKDPFKYKDFFKCSPVHVHDLANLIVSSINSKYSHNKIHAVGGPDKMTWHSILKVIQAVFHKNKLFMPVPISLIYVTALIFDRFKFFPITAAQIKMLMEDNSCDSSELFENYGISPIRFTKESINYLK